MEIYDLNSGGFVNIIPGPSAVILGNFDGVHLGHAELAKKAVSSGLVPVAYFFDDSSRREGVLTDRDEKLRIFASLGIRYAAVQRFSGVRELTPAEFVDRILIKELKCKIAICGFNYKFGCGASGNAHDLSVLMASGGGEADVLSAYSSESGEIISSTAIRTLLGEGKCAEAAQMLGRPYSIILPVIHGDKIGRRLGTPTVNQHPSPNSVKLKAGVYVTECGGHAAVTDIGVRPTVTDAGKRVCETHLIDFEGDLYGENIRVSFYKFIRGEVKFAGTDELREQIQRDVSEARAYFNKK